MKVIAKGNSSTPPNTDNKEFVAVLGTLEKVRANDTVPMLTDFVKSTRTLWKKDKLYYLHVEYDVEYGNTSEWERFYATWEIATDEPEEKLIKEFKY